MIAQQFVLRWLQFFRNFLPTALFGTTLSNLTPLQACFISVMQLVCAFLIPMLIIWAIKKLCEVVF